MRIHFTSASTLALATAATLALPFSASAEDFAVRNGRKVSTSLDMPVGTDVAPAASSYNLTVNVGETVNNGSEDSIYNLTNAGTVNNAGSIYSADVLAGGTLLNKDGGAVKYTSNSGTLVNEGGLYGVNQDAGSFANNAGGSVYGYSQEGGTGTNDGHIVYANVHEGTFTNNADGEIVSGFVDNGTLANSGKITNATVEAPGTLTNNATGEIDNATVNGGTLANNGKIKNANIELNGKLTNNQVGVIEQLDNEGTASNAGLINNVTARAGALTNSSTGTIENLVQMGGTTTNNGKITVTTIQAGTLTNNGLGTIGSATVEGGTLVNNGTIETVSNQAVLTNNQKGVIATLNNAGTATNAGQLGNVTQTAGTLTNNGTITGQALINAGSLTNNGNANALTIAAGATFVNNRNGVVATLNNSGAASNSGTIENASQIAGTLVNSSVATITSLIQSGGETTNNGTIAGATIQGGTLTNNTNGNLGQVNLASGSLNNSGEITSLTVGTNGVFTNGATGTAATVSSGGQSTNEGTIGNLQVTDGVFENSNIITENASVNGGTLTSTGQIGGKLTVNGTAADQGVVNLSGSVGGGINNGANGAINLRGDLTGGGDIINNGTFGSSANRTISGFDTFVNNGTLIAGGGLDIDGDVISSGKIGLDGDLTRFENLNAGGKLTLTSTSETAINIDVGGERDTLTSAGDLTLGGTLKIAATGEDYALKSTFETFTSTAGDVIGNFTDVIVSNVDHLFGLVEETTTGMVVAIRNRDVLDERLAELDLGDDGEILTGFKYTGKEGAELFDTLATVESDDAPGLIAQLTGAAASVVNVGSNAAKGFGSLMQKVATASGLRRGNDRVLAYEKAMAAEQNGKFEPVLREGQGAVGFWARGFGETGSTNGGGDATLGGVGAGVEVAMGEGLTVGASAGYSMANFGLGTTKGKTNSFHAGAYVAVGATAPEAAGFGLTASGSYSKHSTSSDRTINIGTLTSVANANYGGSTIAGEVMVRQGFTIGEKIPLTIAPVAGLKFALDSDDGYTETGAGALNLTVSGAKRKSLVGVVGVQLASRIETESVVFTPHISGTYQHEFLDTSSITTRTLAGSATPFTVKTGGGSGSSVALEAGLGMRFAGGLAVDVSGYGVFGDENRYGATATVKAGF